MSEIAQSLRHTMHEKVICHVCHNYENSTTGFNQLSTLEKSDEITPGEKSHPKIYLA